MMETQTQSIQFQENGTFAAISSRSTLINLNIRIIQTVTASLGIVTNLTVIVVFLNHKKLRRKIPNIFITNQVRVIKLHFFLKLATIRLFVQQVHIHKYTTKSLSTRCILILWRIFLFVGLLELLNISGDIYPGFQSEVDSL